MQLDKVNEVETRERPSHEGKTALGAWSTRPVRQGDIDEIRALLKDVRLPDKGLEDQLAEGYIVAESDGHILGVVGVETYDRYGLLRSLAVLPKWQGSRIGKTLVLDRLYWAKSQGLLSVFLLTTTPRYFEHLGFRSVDRNTIPPQVRFSKEFSSICADTAAALVIPVNGDYIERREEVRSRYAAIAREVEGQSRSGELKNASCCGAGAADVQVIKSAVTTGLYTSQELGEVPVEAAAASLGCGNPTALAELHEGEVVLDLGSGGGIDVLLSARRVGPKGKAYGLDMTDEMLAVARENQRKAGVENVEFLKGEIEAIPLPDNSIDVVISNCVINLSTDKKRVLAEAFRVLKPGGHFAVSDVVARDAVPESLRRDPELWVGCVSGALEQTEYRDILGEAGFTDIDIEATRVYKIEDLCGSPADRVERSDLDGKFMSAFVRATKPKKL